jgi:processive 1,2-diacylglycerol beta-glucosyltransferase
VDALDKSRPFFKFSYTKGYHFLIHYLVTFWQIAFWVTNFAPLRKLSRGIAAYLNTSNCKGFSEYLIKENPDYIISTHFLTSELAGALKIKQKISSRVVTVITDFGVHSFWISPGIDQYIVASSATKDELCRKGVKRGIIKDFGIPISHKFLKVFDRRALSEKIGINPDKFTVLLMTGSFGLGPIEKISRILAGKVQLLVVCARNKRLFERLHKLNLPEVRVFGFIDNSEEMMAVSDVIVTKPGGLSIAEAMVRELIPVFISPIPGQETGNIAALKKHSVGVRPRNLRELKKLILGLKDNPAQFRSMKENIRKIKKPFAACDVAHAIR